MTYSTRDLVGSVTCVWRRKGRAMLEVERYLGVSHDSADDKEKTHFMSSNSPSGGMKLIDRSESNLPSRTH